MDVFFNHLKEQDEFLWDVITKGVKKNPLSVEEEKIHTEAKNYKLCSNCLNMTDLDIMITLQVLHWPILQ